MAQDSPGGRSVAAGGAPDELVLRLHQSGLSGEQMVTLIHALARHKRSDVAVRGLIQYLDFDATGYMPRGHSSNIFAATRVSSDAWDYRRVYPAVEALENIGPFATPYLVEEYIALALRYRTVDERRADRRIRLLAIVLSADIETARSTVDYARRYVATRSGTPAAQAICAELTETVMRQFQGYPTLFPVSVLPK